MPKKSVPLAKSGYKTDVEPVIKATPTLAKRNKKEIRNSLSSSESQRSKNNSLDSRSSRLRNNFTAKKNSESEGNK